MKTLLLIVLLLAILAAAFLVYQGRASADHKSPGLVDGRLSRCGEKPNCVCSEYTDANDHYINAISSTATIDAMSDAVAASGAVIVHRESDYIAATYTSKVFRFVDDLELRRDTEKNLWHIRSASRVGTSDFGANRKRVEALRSALDAI